MPQEDVKHLDTRKVIPDGGRLQGSAEKLSKAADGVYVGWKWDSVKVNTKPEVASELCTEIGVGTFGKGMKTRG